MVCPPGKPPFPASGSPRRSVGRKGPRTNDARTLFFHSCEPFRRASFVPTAEEIYYGVPAGKPPFPASGNPRRSVGRKRPRTNDARTLFFTLSSLFGARRSFLRRKKFIMVCPPGNRRFPQAGTLGGASGASALARTTREPSFSLLRAFSARVVRPAAGTLKRGGTDTSLFHPFWCARRESNPEPTASEAVTLSNCATDTRAALCRRLCLSL